MRWVWALLILIGLLTATRKKYVFSIPKVFIPTSVIGDKSEKDVWPIIRKYIGLRLTTDPKLGFLLYMKPIDGVSLPLSVWLPITAIFALPQIYEQIGKSIIIKKVYVLGRPVGYIVEAKNVTVYM